MLKYKQPNPLNVFGLRQLEQCPPHFTIITFNLISSPKKITDWIYENLEGRFWIGDHYFKSEQGSIHSQKSVGFELASEASYFALMLDQINTAIYY